MATEIDRSRCAAYRDDLNKSLKACEDIHNRGLLREQVCRTYTDKLQICLNLFSKYDYTRVNFHCGLGVIGTVP